MEQVEEHPAGYPRFSALVAAQPSFHICRRFANLRARLLLFKQDELSVLEKRLEKIDKEENSDLFLGSRRHDVNQERQSVISNINAALADYDAFIERTRRIFRYEPAKSRDVQSLRNWLRGNACVSRSEIAYLQKENELLCIYCTEDKSISQLEAWIEDNLVRFSAAFDKRPYPSISSDPNVFIYSNRLLAAMSQVILLLIVTFILLVPMLICLAVESITSRAVIVAISTTFFIATLSTLTRARSIELFVAGSTYATVLVVFISNMA
ncbi:hypothetical protein MGYG_08600 [Nannizzia gypsea CBS 118893]|uniref:DUF6594 domain-containing protein n=1 Tax=Arthroderma gypseum (strain ATCC MYA-4604 / CBS 118893) TaxID=535722 RepID=E4V6G1_ARTGP|nr:hypothetical protein MGYG_08600 [Nannizzia gypsea CBS 118893]EFQ96677.1 hypothetical protein MGYG_08600 [Nannizzia gypsea CBS 118893]